MRQCEKESRRKRQEWVSSQWIELCAARLKKGGGAVRDEGRLGV